MCRSTRLDPSGALVIATRIGVESVSLRGSAYGYPPQVGAGERTPLARGSNFGRRTVKACNETGVLTASQPRNSSMVRSSWLSRPREAEEYKASNP
jgi:hypothetical protein